MKQVVMIEKGSGKVQRVGLPAGTDPDKFVAENKGYEIIDTVLEAGKLYKKVNGKIVEDKASMKAILVTKVKSTARQLLASTDYLMLVDNPGNLSEVQLVELTAYRKALREATTKLPEKPSFI